MNFIYKYIYFFAADLFVFIKIEIKIFLNENRSNRTRRRRPYGFNRKQIMTFIVCQIERATDTVVTVKTENIFV